MRDHLTPVHLAVTNDPWLALVRGVSGDVEKLASVSFDGSVTGEREGYDGHGLNLDQVGRAWRAPSYCVLDMTLLHN